MSSAFLCIIPKRRRCLFIYEKIGESQAISHSDDTEQQVAGNPRFSTKTPLENADYRERRRRRQQEAAHKGQRTSLSTAKATSSTQRPKTCTEAATKYTITLQTELMKREKTDCRRFKKRWGDQAMLIVYSKIIFFDAAISSESYTICTMHVKNIFPKG